MAGAALTVFMAACGGSGSGDERATPTSKPAATSGSPVDACAIVTQADATAIFGQPAVRQDGPKISVPIMIGECIWT